MLLATSIAMLAAALPHPHPTAMVSSLPLPAVLLSELPPFEDVAGEYEPIISTADGSSGFWSLYRDPESDHLLIELPPGSEGQGLLVAFTIARGTIQAGVQMGDQYLYWTRLRDRILLMHPNIAVLTSGDFESQQGHERVFTDQLVMDLPVLCEGPGGGPVIDGTALFLHGASQFTGRGARSDLGTIAKAKSFPGNVELAFDLPLADGRMGRIYYSIRGVPEEGNYEPRLADHRIGYFTTTHKDIGDPSVDDPWVRYVTRWRLEKADPSLKTSPPKEPIVFYLEHTIPVRYRRWVREGVLEWNRAFEQIGIVNAIEVYQQDARTGAHMDKDPEDARYNFILWTNSSMGFAIGPSRIDPRTGQILDADIVMDEGFISGWVNAWKKLLPEVAMENFDAATRQWLSSRPHWDPRVRLAPPHLRAETIARIRSEQAAGHPAQRADASLIGDQEYDGLAGRTSQVNGACLHGMVQAAELALVRMHPAVIARLQDDADGDEGGDGEDGPDMLDGVPDWFIGPLLRDIIMHETGHTLGLRHNFKASTIYGMAQMNDENFEPEAICGSVMEYSPININVEDGPSQGDFTMMTIGPYDYWAIEYGYTPDDESLDGILSRVNEPLLTYATDEDTFGSDPTARRFDWSSNPLDYADSQIRLVQELRSTLLDRMVEDGDSWAKARKGYEMLLYRQVSAVSMAADWIGGSIHNRGRKGDPGDRDPIEDLDPNLQRRAMGIVLVHTMRDEAYGLSPQLLSKMTIEKWWDDENMADIFDDPPWPIHERISGIQASALSMLLNPGTLARVHDAEYRIPAGDDAFTMAELIRAVTDESWSELSSLDRRSTARQPAISSLRRNLQVEHLGRLVELSLMEDSMSPAHRTMQSLCRAELREIAGRIDDAGTARLDPYSAAHLIDARDRITKALDAQYTIGSSDGGGGLPSFLFLEPPSN